MKVKVSDYIADFLISRSIDTVFTVVGGGAMHLNDSFGHNKNLHCVYNHHEQASAMAAECYARVAGKLAALCVTSGPGAINALNGVVGAYQDSIPMLVFSGQVKTALMVRNSGLALRTLGGQEFDIVSALEHGAKYAETVLKPERIRYCLEKAYSIAISGRPGPCWLDLPLDIQGAFVESDDLEGYSEIEKQKTVSVDEIQKVMSHLKEAKRPVLYAGNGIRLAGAVNLLHEVSKKFQIPVVTCWDSIDLIATEDMLYAGRGGTMGDRAGNFAVQNSDFLLAVGSRLSIYQVGYQKESWARVAYKVAVDIDPEELLKPIFSLDLPICSDAKDFLQTLMDEDAYGMTDRTDWIQQCAIWKKKYPVVTEDERNQKNITNVYAFIDGLSHSLPEGAVSVVANGSASVVGSQTWYIKKDQRFLMNCAISSMGYGLPASIGACIANDYQPVVCLEGDGSIMMNLQELQTVVTNKLPIHIFIINNEGYHQIRQTQNNIFHDGLVGVGPESGDLGFPSFEKLAGAFGIPYYSIKNNLEISTVVDEVLTAKGYTLCEVFCDIRRLSAFSTEGGIEGKHAYRQRYKIVVGGSSERKI